MAICGLGKKRNHEGSCVIHTNGEACCTGAGGEFHCALLLSLVVTMSCNVVDVEWISRE